MMLYEEGAFELTDPVSEFIPAFADVRVYAGGSDQQQVTVPATEPVRIWHLLTHTSGLTYGFHRVHPVDACTGRPGSSGARRRDGPGAGRATRGRPCRCCSSRARSGTTRWRPTCSAGWSRSPPGSALDEFFAAADLRPARHDRHRLLGRADGRSPAGRAVPPGPGRQGGQAGRPRPGARAGRRACSAAAAACSRRPPTTTASPRCCWARPAARRGTGRRPAAQPPHGRATWPATTCPAAWTWRRSAGRCTRSPRSAGVGFGLGFARRASTRCRARCCAPRASSSWGGAASTAFWVDPPEELAVLVLHPAAAVEHLPDPAAAAPARLPGADRLRIEAERAGVIRPGHRSEPSHHLHPRHTGHPHPARRIGS